MNFSDFVNTHRALINHNTRTNFKPKKMNSKNPLCSLQRPGPTQPLKWLQRCIETLVPKQKSPVRPKILVGISLHGNVFTPTEMKSLNGKV